MPKDRGAEEGDVDGHLECSQALGMVATETRGEEAPLPGKRRAPSLDWRE